MEGGLRIGGAPPVTLRAQGLAPDVPAFVEATVLPGRGMMLLQARLRLPSGEVVDALASPAPAEAAARLSGGAEDFAGNLSFAFGGAILAPFANRITGRPLSDSREIETEVAGKLVRLPRNWGGKAPGAAQYAMHGLILQAGVAWSQGAPDRVTGELAAGDFEGHWTGEAHIAFEWRLEAGALRLRVEVGNRGQGSLPMGVGWHPYFALPSGDRSQARLRLAAQQRATVDNYDEVLPTGQLEAVAGGPYEFDVADGRALGDQYLDDCFTGLRRGADGIIAEIRDPAANLGLRLTSPSPCVRAVQVYAPPGEAFVVVEPQTNLADPYGAQWGGQDTGMALIVPGDTMTYDVRVEPFDLRNP